jgi:hypothetical protein
MTEDTNLIPKGMELLSFSETPPAFQRWWVLWLKSRGAPETGYASEELVDGMPQAYTYSQWILGRWEAWARSLGVTELGPHPWDRWSTAALNKGHTRDEFATWLEENWSAP